ncbi:hypothetical protein H6G80_33570 [Nostoc sp. FACHB-87]|uniref:hypothetical protein n=1 Tax=Nostocaceae TaxID=1162 RepID=UPI0016879EEE|nr:MULTISPECIES: hypothetical protein [Nostocaceae]MBD2458968.1 hypothetical protein [Nostoc sp. FACHB-87]MBD2480134.1 hypothetical protein [Anabaena sp. FACHB-83]
MRDRVSLETVSLSLPFGIGSMSWKVNTTEQRAAWSLYVELVTRIAVQPLQMEQGLVREAMNSLYSLFATTREILKAAGPDVGASRDSVGGIAIAVLNNGLRPFLSKWHPLLQAWEARKPVGVSPREHEQSWSEEATARQELEALRVGLEQYAQALATIAGVEE